MTLATADSGRTEIAPGIHAVPAPFEGVPVTVYAVEGAGLSLVDAGVATTPRDDLLPALEGVGHGMRGVDWLINTHAHHDHFGGNSTVRQLSPRVRIAVHALDAPWAESARRYVAGLYRASFPGTWDPTAEFEQRLLRLCARDAAVDRRLEHGEVIDLGAGRELRVHWTPAHSPGHVVLFDGASRTAFAGDVIQRRGTEIEGRPWLFPFYTDVAAYRRSLATLRALRPAITCTTHFGVLDLEDCESLIAESEAMLDEIDALLRELLSSRATIELGDAAAAARARWPHYEHGLALHATLAAHLDAMVGAARARAWIDNNVKRWETT